MSLQVWIPGTDGTLKNKGLLLLPSPSYNNITSVDSGKLGKCIKNMAIYHLSSDFLTGNWTVACWTKFLSTYSASNNIILVINSSDSSDSKLYLSFISNTVLQIGRGTANLLYYTIPNSGTFSNDTWYHIAASWDGTTLSLYLNGTRVAYSTSSVGSYKSALNLGINCRATAAAGTGPTGSGWPINDIRIYDNALSASEVKEISRGLVCRYLLNDDSVESTTNLCGAKGYTFDGWSSYGFGSTGSKTITSTGSYCSGLLCLVTDKSSTTSNHYVEMANWISGPNLTSGLKVTGSVYVKGTNATIGKTCFLHIYNSNGTDTQSDTVATTTLTDLWQRISGQFTWSKSTTSSSSYSMYVVCNMQSGESFYFSNVQLEAKDHATAWTPSSRTAGLVYDISGYNYNGTPTNITYNTDSPVFKGSYTFNKSAIYNTYTTNGLTNLTYSAWVKLTSYASERCTICIGGTYFTVDSNGKLSGYAYGKSPAGYHSGSTTVPLNTWTHVALVWEDSYLKGYVNGNLDFTVACTGTFNLAVAQSIGCESNSVNNRTLYGKISDFRIYSTALSASDILEIYNQRKI